MASRKRIIYVWAPNGDVLFAEKPVYKMTECFYSAAAAKKYGIEDLRVTYKNVKLTIEVME